jgi:hypothetical protein
MKFLINVIDTQSRSPHSSEEMQAIDDINDQMQAAGQRIFAGGIAAPSESALFDYRTGNSSVVEGPLIPHEEFISGFWVVEVDSKETARSLAAEASAACNRKVELRPLLG